MKLLDALLTCFQNGREKYLPDQFISSSALFVSYLAGLLYLLRSDVLLASYLQKDGRVIFIVALLSIGLLMSFAIMLRSRGYLKMAATLSLKASKSRRLPSSTAEFLLHLFMESRSCDALVGDLNERHRILRKRFGIRKANFWYWVQVLRSVGPIVWGGSVKIIKRLSGLAAVVEAWKRMRG